MAKYYSGITTGTTLDSMLASGSEFGIFPSQDIDCQDISTSGIAHIIGGIKDTSGDMGNSGQVLSSTGSGLNWINPGDANVSSASNVGTNDASSTDATHYLAFVSSTSGNNPVRIDTGLTYNPSSNILTVGTISATNIEGSLTAGGAVPPGAIIMWSGAENKIGESVASGGTGSGWYLCNGSNGTPDLRDRFIVGAGNNYSVGATGGSKDATLVSHSHTVNSHTHGDGSLSTDTANLTGTIYKISECYNVAGSASGVFTKLNTGNSPVTGSSSNSPTAGVNFNANHSHDVTGSTGSANPGTNSQGSSATNANLPPYYALCYIMKS